MIDPLTRWAAYGEKPDYAGLMTYAGLPYTEDPAELAGVDAAIVGAPMDELTSDSPGTRFGPRAIRAASCAPGPHLEAGVDALRDVLRVVDFGDAPILPADPVRSHQAIQDTVAQVLAAGAIPIILGGDHSIAEPDIRAVAEVHGPVGLIHFDTHTDTGARSSAPRSRTARACTGSSSRATSTRTATSRSACAATGRAQEEFAWQRERGIVSHFMHDVRERGIGAVVADAIAHVGAGPVFLSVDIDVLDPAFAPGTGTPEPGGMTSADLLWACREIGASVAARRRRGGRGAAGPDRLARHHRAGRRARSCARRSPASRSRVSLKGSDPFMFSASR